jgi:hypothetical protein
MMTSLPDVLRQWGLNIPAVTHRHGWPYFFSMRLLDIRIYRIGDERTDVVL